MLHFISADGMVTGKMIDLDNLEKYRENNRIEAKRALGGLPKSIWETYSAFANTIGGMILLGVEERRDKSLKAIDLPDPHGLIREFWRLVNDKKKVSVNVLSRKDITVHKLNGKHIISIDVPRADRRERPVYVDGDLYTGTYRRDGEGDYHCSREEVERMMRDAGKRDSDSRIIESLGAEVFVPESVARFRADMGLAGSNHLWESLSEGDLLTRAGALKRGEDDLLHPTEAGLLMFGNNEAIRSIFPEYRLEYRELDCDYELSYRLTSDDESWSGNVLDFYFRTCDKLSELLSCQLQHKPEEPLITMALKEALVNCIVNADYSGNGGIVVMKRPAEFIFSNPGSFRMDVEQAKYFGSSDPRNSTMNQIFKRIGLCEGTGSGLVKIFSAWQQKGWPQPMIKESFHPERITLILSFDEENLNPEANPSKWGRRRRLAFRKMRKETIIDYVTRNVTATADDIADLLMMPTGAALELIHELSEENILVTEVIRGKTVCRLKS